MIVYITFPNYLVVEIGRTGRQHTAMGPEHMSLHLYGEVTQPALLALAVQVVQHGGAGSRETHLEDAACCRSTGSTEGLIHSPGALGEPWAPLPYDFVALIDR